MPGGVTGAGLESRELGPDGTGGSGAGALADEDGLGDFLFESTLDHLQREEVLALLAQHPSQALDVAARRTCGTPTGSAPG